MSLCIAAACDDNDEARIILCADWKQSTRIADAEVADKLRWIQDGRWAALIADDAGHADRMANVFRNHFQTLTDPITEENVYHVLDGGLQQYRRALVDEYLISRLGTTYEELVSDGAPLASGTLGRRFPEAFVLEKLHEIETIPDQAQLIIAGFTSDKKPIICAINEDPPNGAPLRFDRNFAAIGSGAAVAITALSRREYQATETPLMKAVYLVYEAKCLGEISPAVGETTSIDILQPDGEVKSLSDKGHTYCERRYDELNPPIHPRVKFTYKEQYLEPFEFDWAKGTST